MAESLRRLHIWLLGDRTDRGASLVEYALLVTLIALVCFAAIGFLGESTSASYDDVGSSVANSN